MKIVLGVTGGIAAYKSALLLRLLTEAGHDVRVIPTANSLNFVGAATWEALSHHPVTADVFESIDEVQHVRLGQEAELIVVAPATADFLAKVAAGRADDLLTTTIIASRAPVVLAPAMHTEMWENAATKANVATLRSRGMTVIEPASGRLTGTDTGPGRLPDPEVIRDAALAAAAGAQSEATGESAPEAPSSAWSGKKVVVTLGGTREALDPVRFLGNRSSGKQGLAFAQALASQGASVQIIAGSVEIPLDESIPTRRIQSALELQAALDEELVGADALVMAAAVADFRPKSVAGAKIKKRDDGQDPVIELERNPDIIAGLTARKQDFPGVRFVAFAAETGDEHGTVLEYGQQKLARKKVDALCVNRVSTTEGFGTDENAITVLFQDASEPFETSGSKTEIAARIVAELGERFYGPEQPR